MWYEGEEYNAPYSVQMLIMDGYDYDDIERFFNVIISKADKEDKVSPNWKDAKKCGVDTEAYKKVRK